MSVLQAPHTLEENGEYAKKYIILPSATLGMVESFFKIVQGIKTRSQVIFISPVSKITVRDTGCDSEPNDKQPVRTEKWWEPHNVEALLTQCYTDVYGSIMEAYLQDGNDKYDLEGTEVEKLLLELIVPAAQDDRVRMSWLSKYAITAGELSGGAPEVKNYNQMDGFFEKMRVAALAGTVKTYTIAKNAGATYAAQELAPGEARTILNGVKRKQSLYMKQFKTKDKVYFVTRSIYENLAEELENNSALETSWKRMQDGSDTLTLGGIPLIILDAVDTAIDGDFNNGTKWDMPHRVVLTVKDNLQVGLDVDNGIVFETWVVKLSKRWYARLMYKIDTQIADERLVVYGR